MSNEQEQQMARARKRAPSRDKAEEVRRIVMSLCEEHVEPFPEGCTDCKDAARLEYVAEFLGGQLYPLEEFTNSRQRGLYHVTKSRMFLMEWLRQRGRFDSSAESGTPLLGPG